MLDILFTVVCVLFIFFVWIILYDSNRFTVTRHRIVDPRIKKSCRAVVLADLHNKLYGKDNERLLEAIREYKPDFILMAGDMLTARPRKTLDIALSLMKELAGDYPIYYGNGNHEYRLKLYPENYGDMAERYEKALSELGIHRLVNSHVDLQELGITIYGAEIDKIFYKRFRVQKMSPKYLKQIMGVPKPENYTVLIAHNPDYFPSYAAWGADLVLAGHVHGGMVRVPFLDRGVISPNVRLFPKYDSGVYREGDSVMLLSRGLGMHTIPVRMFNPGEVIVIDFDNPKL
ncbi:MAG: metallophosphoesterase [Candidatus Gastranaerophilales bacterium]|nr:metallophosphoesterase [Candidatus Gastranaerophilales bacterium]